MKKQRWEESEKSKRKKLSEEKEFEERRSRCLKRQSWKQVRAAWKEIIPCNPGDFVIHRGVRSWKQLWKSKSKKRVTSGALFGVQLLKKVSGVVVRSAH